MFIKTVSINTHRKKSAVIKNVMEECIMAWKNVYKIFLREKIGTEIICKLFLVPSKMEKANYSLSLSLITAKNSE